MGIINLIFSAGALVDLIIILIIAFNAYIGYKRGLATILFKILTFIVSLLVVFILYKPVSNLIISTTSIDENLSQTLQNILMQTPIANGEQISIENSNMSTGVTNLINSYVSEAITNTQENIIPYVSMQLSYSIIRIAVTIILLAISKFALSFLRIFIQIIAGLPIISMFNSSGGIVCGILKSLITIYIVLAIFSLLSPLISSWGIISAIEKSYLGSIMFNHNFIINLFMH